jgi:hypothetical protein
METTTTTTTRQPAAPRDYSRKACIVADRSVASPQPIPSFTYIVANKLAPSLFLFRMGKRPNSLFLSHHSHPPAAAAAAGCAIQYLFYAWESDRQWAHHVGKLFNFHDVMWCLPVWHVGLILVLPVWAFHFYVPYASWDSHCESNWFFFLV